MGSGVSGTPEAPRSMSASESVQRPAPARARTAAPTQPLPARLIAWFAVSDKRMALALASLALLLHLVVILYGTTPVHDEHYYVSEGRSILNGVQVALAEHPPLGKLFIAFGMGIFGDNALGWRIFPVLFGVVSVSLFYLVCRRLAGRLTAVFASILLIFENLIFVFSGIAMLEVFSLTFMLLSFLLYLQNRHALSGVSLALSGLCKMTGLFGGLVILIHWLVTKRRDSFRRIPFFLLSATAAFLLLMPLLDRLTLGEWLSPFSRLHYMLVYHQGLTWDRLTPELIAFGHPSTPWHWIVSPQGYYMSTYAVGFDMMLNYTIWVLIIPSMCYMIYDFARNRTSLSLFVILWFAATYLPWVFIAASGRITSLYYFYPTAGAICMAVGFALSKLWQCSIKQRLARYRLGARIFVCLYFIAHIYFFFIFSPVVYAIRAYVLGSPGEPLWFWLK